ncbi:MAG: ATP synthase F0 subunit C [candidate division WOR-3 bacterium]
MGKWRWLVGVGVFFLLEVLAFAAEPEVAGITPDVKRAIAFAAGFGIAIAAIGGAISQARAIAAALDGIARNPAASGRIVTPMIIGLAMIESLVIYALLVALLMVFKL